ncbi:histone-lysine N-methyltransferase, H3 lysine-9 specific SUVH6-like [Dorcoceras hygrometricum]|uniref:Histone-lysine N-methyltransferase, H3 lysine-9 specific SUVH6-like n=1 Tax=Dorcoceras hygrometricum TaxID=472368 RepID=A0A2Z7AGH5_9LAMI|nr:histone-lysine N-methyltransferase, H3 lysine-9 specific SUVH6-like [Dorcoceras hygrometricum]
MDSPRRIGRRQFSGEEGGDGGGAHGGGGGGLREERGRRRVELSTCVTLNGSGIQLAVGPQPLRLRNHNSGLAHRIMVKRLATSPHDPLGITDSACKNQLVVVSVQYGPFNPYIPIRSTTIDSIGYPRMSASGESSTTMHRLRHASGSHPIPTPYDPKRVGKRVKVRRLSCRVSMTFRVVRTNQYNQDLRLIHSTNGNHLESPKEGSSIDHQTSRHDIVGASPERRPAGGRRHHNFARDKHGAIAPRRAPSSAHIGRPATSNYAQPAAHEIATRRLACTTSCADDQQLSAASRAAGERPARATALMVRPSMHDDRAAQLQGWRRLLAAHAQKFAQCLALNKGSDARPARKSRWGAAAHGGGRRSFFKFLIRF